MYKLIVAALLAVIQPFYSAFATNNGEVESNCGYGKFRSSFLLTALLAFSSGAWAHFNLGPTTAREYAKEISHLQMATHYNEANFDARITGVQSIPYVDVIPRGGLADRILIDPGTKQNTESWIRNLGIVREVNGKKILRLFLHPEDYTYRDMIFEALREQKDVIVGEGHLEAFPSGSRSLFVVSGNEILMLKMSTTMVNNRLEHKKFTPSMAFASVMNSAVLRKHIPGTLLEEPLAVKIAEDFAYVVRKFADFAPNDKRLWVPGYAFGFSRVESSMFAEYKGVELRSKVKREWVRLSTRVGVLRELSNNHAQNLVVALNRHTGEILESHLLDALDMKITQEDFAEGLEILGLERSPFGDPVVSNSSHRLAVLQGWGLANIEVPLNVVGEYFRADTADLPIELVGRMIRNLFKRNMLEPLWRRDGWPDSNRHRLVGYLTRLFELQDEGFTEDSRRREIIKAIIANWPASESELLSLWRVHEGSSDRFAQYVREGFRERPSVLRPTGSCSSFVQKPAELPLGPFFGFL